MPDPSGRFIIDAGAEGFQRGDRRVRVFVSPLVKNIETVGFDYAGSPVGERDDFITFFVQFHHATAKKA